MKNYLLLLLFSLLTLSFHSNAQEWERLGSRVVNFGLERDVIQVGANEGGFTKLKIEVRGGAINMHRLVVEYGNGERDEIELRHNFVRGSDSRIIDLNGGKRIIKNITFVYDTKNLARRKAVVHVFGKH